MIWYDVIWYDMISYHIISYDKITWHPKYISKFNGVFCGIFLILKIYRNINYVEVCILRVAHVPNPKHRYYFYKPQRSWVHFASNTENVTCRWINSCIFGSDRRTTQLSIVYILYYHLVYMNTSILLVESQVILNRITGFKSKNILKCEFKAKTRRAQCAWSVWRACVSKALPQTGNTVPYYLFDYGNTENINLNILLGCLVV